MKVEPATSATKVNFALVLSVISAGAVRNLVIGGAATTHSYRAGVESQLPATSRARMRRTCVPRTRSDHWSGEVHELYEVPSRAHWNTSAPFRLSVPLNSNVATVLTSTAGGVEVMNVSGGVISGPSSTVHSYRIAGSSITPSGFVARTSNLCSPLSSRK